MATRSARTHRSRRRELATRSVGWLDRASNRSSEPIVTISDRDGRCWMCAGTGNRFGPEVAQGRKSRAALLSACRPGLAGERRLACGTSHEAAAPLQRLIICILLSGTWWSESGGVVSRCARDSGRMSHRVLSASNLRHNVRTGTCRQSNSQTQSTRQLFAPCPSRCRSLSARSGAFDASAARAATSRK